MPTKSRSQYTGIVTGTDRASIFDPLVPYQYNGPLSIETSYSINHAKWPGGRWEGGGPWRLERSWTTYDPSPSSVVVDNYNTGGGYLGTGSRRIETPTDGVVNFAPPVPPSNSSLYADATTAIARIEPTKPAFDLSVFLGELRAEGIPNMPGQALREHTRLAKASGGEYLNVEFGWLPLVRGVRDFANVVHNSDKIVNSYQERANRVTKRSYEWPEYSEVAARACNFSMLPPIGFFTGGGFHQRKFTRKWLEVDFIYYLPTGSSRGEKISRYGSYARKLLGIDLTPEVLWNLSPWSWAADWFANTGDVMHNLSALGTDGLLMRNGYIMCHSGLVSNSSGTYYPFGRPPLRMVRTTTEETKIRLDAHPFGFGVTSGSLNMKQKAILGALGLSKFA
nr:MAG: hypothetical protein 1 [Leviviridae sp.]